MVVLMMVVLVVLVLVLVTAVMTMTMTITMLVSSPIFCYPLPGSYSYLVLPSYYPFVSTLAPCAHLFTSNPVVSPMNYPIAIRLFSHNLPPPTTTILLLSSNIIIASYSLIGLVFFFLSIKFSIFCLLLQFMYRSYKF